MRSEHDVIVVGGGVIGCAVAYELAKRSVNVLLLDRSLPGRATSASAGGLWPVAEAVGLGCGIILHASQVESSSTNKELPYGPDALPTVFRDFLVASNARFPSLAPELLETAGIDIEYDAQAGLLFAIYSESEMEFVERLSRSLPDDVSQERLTAQEVGRLEPHLTKDLLGGVLFPREHQVNPMMLAEAFKRAAIRLGATFLPATRATSLRKRSNRIIGVQVDQEFFPCQTVVNACGAWASRLASTVGVELPVRPVRGQIVLTETLPPMLSVGVSTSRTYLTQKVHGEILIGSTTEEVGFDVSVTHESVQKLCVGAIRCVPMLRNVQLRRVWAGLRPATPDELPIFGAVDGLEGYVNAAGGFRTGIVAAPLTGEVIAQLICSQPTSFPVERFLMSRFDSVLAVNSEF